MVAELTDIPVANAERKRLTADPEQFISSIKQKNRPKWIQAATREPTYSVLDINDRSIDNNILFGQKRNVVVITAVKSDKTRGNDLEISRIEQKKVPNVWLPTVNKLTYENSTILEAEDEDPLYSVVKKPKKVQLPDTGFLESKLQPIKEQSSGERSQIQICSRQEELRRWLQVASTRLPEPRRLFSFREMYTNQLGKFDQIEDWKGAVAMPRGIVGLVGPYRVYQNPNERREYMLQEEELVEEVVDSVSEIAANGNNRVTEYHQRAKWRIREDDEETLVPDIRNIPGLEEFAVETEESKELSDWKKVDDQVIIDYSKNDEELKSKEDEFKGDIDEIVSGKEERAVDVPEEASTVSTTSVKDKKGERVFCSVNGIIFAQRYF